MPKAKEYDQAVLTEYHFQTTTQKTIKEEKLASDENQTKSPGNAGYF